MGKVVTVIVFLQEVGYAEVLIPAAQHVIVNNKTVSKLVKTLINYCKLNISCDHLLIRIL